MKKTILILLIQFIWISPVFSQAQYYSRALIHLNGRPLSELGSAGIDVLEGVIRKDQSFTTDLERAEIEKVRKAGFRVDILIDDVRAYYRERSAHPHSEDAHAKTGSTGCAGGTGANAPAYPQPQHFQLGSYAGFFTYQEMLDQLDSMRALYPNLITAKQGIPGGTSIEGDSILWIRVSDNADQDENEPEVLYTALHHAREPGGLSALMYYLWYLLENYSTNADIQSLVDHTEMYFVPCINPDGYKYNELIDPAGGGLWRKNRRDNGDGTFGVDLNRNYAFQWGYDNIGSSPVTDDFTYRGDAPASEPEIQLVNSFVNSRQFRLAMNYHTFGNLLINPWGYIPNFYTVDSLVFDAMGNALTTYNNYLNGTSNQTVGYNVNGGSDDWMYGEQTSKPKIFSFTPECGTGSDFFWPQPNRIVPICQENMWSNLLLARLAGPYARLTPEPAQALSALNGYLRYSLQQLGLDTTGIYTVSITGLSSNVATTGSPKTYGPLTLLQLLNDSLSFGLSSTIQQGDEVRFVLQVQNGLYTLTDTLAYVFGTYSTLLNDPGNTLASWSGSWGITGSDFVSAPTSITDSPNGNYNANANSSLSLSGQLDLTNATRARLDFQATWDIESDYDFVQIEASSDNGITWTPLCGRYTKDPVMHATTGPLYDGFSGWVAESMSLNDYTGQVIKIRFRLGSDGVTEQDGFYFDDLAVKVITATGVAETVNIKPNVYVYPNPASEQVNFRLPFSDSNGIMEISDLSGKLLLRAQGNGNSVQSFETGTWSIGTYLYRYIGSYSVYTGCFQVQH